MLKNALLLFIIIIFTGCVERGYELTVDKKTNTVTAIKSVDIRTKATTTIKADMEKMNVAVHKEQKKQHFINKIVKKDKNAVEKTNKKKIQKVNAENELQKQKKLEAEKKAQKEHKILKEKRAKEKEEKRLADEKEKVRIKKEAEKKKQEALRKIKAMQEKEAMEKKLAQEKALRIAKEKEAKLALERKMEKEKQAQLLKAKKEKALLEKKLAQEKKRAEEKRVALLKQQEEAKKIRLEKEAQARKEKEVAQRKKALAQKKSFSTTEVLTFKPSSQTYQKFGTSEIHGHVVYLTPSGQEINLQNTKIYLVPKNIKTDYWYNHYYLKNKESSSVAKTVVHYINATHLNLEKNFAFYGLAPGIYYIIIESSYPPSVAKNKKVYIAKKINVEKYKKIMTVFSKKL